MTDYTKSTNFASKDSLLSGNPLKIVKGTEIDTEFNNIATAVATKADLASPALTGTPTAPTASVGTNTTQLATAALVFATMQAIYPVGSIYTNISSSTNPGTLFGFGTWVALEGVTIYGRSSTDTTFGTAGATGGSKDAIVVSHTHSVTDPGHSHNIYALTGRQDTWNEALNNDTAKVSGEDTGGAEWYGGKIQANTTGISIASTGSSGTNANLPPYIVAYMWKRTA
jgi:hypothetical protein